MEYLFAFGAAFVLSFMGTLPPGVLNMTVVRLSIHKNIKIALIFALGTVVVEFFQVFFMVKFVNSVQRFLDGNVYVYWFAFLLLVGLGISSLVFKPKKIENNPSISYNPFKAFLHGALLSGVNALAYIFWLMLAVYFVNDGVQFSNPWILFLFSFGSLLGAFLVQLLYSLLGVKILSRFDFFIKNINNLIALVFFALAILQLIKIIGMSAG